MTAGLSTQTHRAPTRSTPVGQCPRANGWTKDGRCQESRRAPQGDRSVAEDQKELGPKHRARGTEALGPRSWAVSAMSPREGVGREKLHTREAWRSPPQLQGTRAKRGIACPFWGPGDWPLGGSGHRRSSDAPSTSRLRPRASVPCTPSVSPLISSQVRTLWLRKAT